MPPEFHVYPYRNNQPLDPRQVQLGMSVSRLGGEVDQFAFQPQQDYLRADAVVHEPHSFDVAVTATLNGTQHAWTYASYEGRTTIAQAAADAAGVKTETAGQAVMEESITAAGRVELQPQGRNEVRAWYPGRVDGDDASSASACARARCSRASNPAKPADLFDPRADGGRDHRSGSERRRRGRRRAALSSSPMPPRLHAEFFVFPGDAERVRAGQPVEVRSVSGDSRVHALRSRLLLPIADLASQTLVAHVELPPNGIGDMAARHGRRGLVRSVATRPFRWR